MVENIVTRWFGPHFADLHPLLQDLHRHGGQLRGPVAVTVGKGVAGWMGRRLAAKLGIPVGEAAQHFVVDIRHAEDALHWDRQFANGATMHSRFVPVGSWPDGYWIEHSGALQLRLTVDVVEGGWYWRLLGMRLAGLPLPIWLFPKPQAYKRIEQGRYRFCVAFTLPLVGEILCYQGLLAVSA